MADPTSDAETSSSRMDEAAAALSPGPLLGSWVGHFVRVWRTLQHYQAGRAAVFILLAVIGFLYGLSFLGISSGGTSPKTYGDIVLYVKGVTAKSATLDIKYDPGGSYSLVSIRPAFNVPSGQSVYWAVLVSKALGLHPLPGDTAGFVNPTDNTNEGYPWAKVQSVSDKYGRYWLFTGIVSGPANELNDERFWRLSGWGSFFTAPAFGQTITRGIEAAGPVYSANSGGRFSFLLPAFSNFGPDERSGFSVSAGQQLRYGNDMTDGTQVEWHPLNVTVHLEAAIGLEGVRLDSVIPPANQTGPQGLGWDVPSTQIPFGFAVAGANLAAESSAQNRVFFAGILMALSGSALLAAFQEHPKNLKHAAGELWPALVNRMRLYTRRGDQKANKDGEAKDKAGKVRGYPVLTRAFGFFAAAWLISNTPVINYQFGIFPLASGVALLALTLMLGVIFTTVAEFIYGSVARGWGFPRYRTALQAGYGLAVEGRPYELRRRKQFRVWVSILYCLFFVAIVSGYISLPISLFRLIIIMALGFIVLA